MAIIRTENVTKGFGGLIAVNQVSVDIHPDQLTSIIGPNGAGKSTFFNIITGFFKPDEGRIFFRDEDITGLPIHQIVRKGISRSFQILNIFEESTVWDNVWVAVQGSLGYGKELLGRVEKLAGVEEETSRIIAEMGLEYEGGSQVKYLSYGEKRLLEIALALTTRPKILLLDEPMSGLPADERRRISAYIKQIAQAVTVVVVEHDMDVVMAISDRILVMYEGRILASGTPAEVRQDVRVQEAYLGAMP